MDKKHLRVNDFTGFSVPSQGVPDGRKQGGRNKECGEGGKIGKE